MEKGKKNYKWILGIGIGIFLSGCGQDVKSLEYTGLESRITKEECIFCSEENSIFKNEEILLGMCNVNTGEEIDLVLGNNKNSKNVHDTGRKELNFSEEDATVVQMSSLKGRDVCEVSLYLDKKSGVRRKAEKKLCQECVEKASEGNTEYVIADHRNRKIYPVQQNHKLLFAGDYAAHVDWDEKGQRMDIFFFYSPSTSETGI